MTTKTHREGTAFLLAGGDAHRFPTDQPAAVQTLAGKAVLFRVLETVESLGLSNIVVISQLKELKKDLQGRADFVWQPEPKGSGRALLVAEAEIRRASDPILVVYVNHPFIRTESLRLLLDQHDKTGAASTFLSTKLDKPHGHARVIRDASGAVLGTSRDCEIGDQQLKIREVIAGAYCFKKEPLLAAMDAYKQEPMFYLTQLITHTAAAGSITAIPIPDPLQARGVYSPADLQDANKSSVR